MLIDPAQLDELFAAALAETAPGARAAFVEKASAANPELRERLEALLAAHDATGNFLKLPGADEATVQLAQLSERPGTVIGPYKLLQQIGEGGMGVVFMAEQAEPIQRTVALKIIKPGMDTRQVIARFEAERQALALMDHPNIAKVLDAGTTDTGRPYFVMELVKGMPITKYCDEHHMTPRERLELFLPVCQAVQHAHQKGIIHRDLKPSNVLIALYDGHPVPKIIDFGVAKATGSKLTERTLFTEFGAILGTLEYMSPEQAELNQLDVDTRSDIYSLGVLLYELLTGTTPLERKRIKATALHEALRVIREEEPPKPSTRLSTAEGLPSIAANRGLEPAKLSGQVRGELDWIVMKALEKDRNRRYETANGFAADVQRYLADEAVQACPPSAGYRLRKFVRRNKGSVLAGLAIVSALAIGLAVATVGFVRARTEAGRSAQVAQFLKDTLAAAGPSFARGRDATLLREILDKTAQRLAHDLQHQPEVQGDLWMTLGKTYSDLGDYPRAVTLYQHAVDNYRIVHGNKNATLALALGSLGQCKSLSGQVAAGKADTELALQIARKCGDKKVIARCLFCRAKSLDQYIQGVEGIPLFREAIALGEEVGDDPVFLASLILSLGGTLNDSGESSEEAEPLMRQALALQRQHLDPDHPAIIGSLYQLAQCMQKLQRLEEAETLGRELVVLGRKVYHKDHPSLTLFVGFLSDVLMLSDKRQEAEAVLNEAIESSASNGDYWNLLGEFSAARGNLSAAVEQFLRAAELSPKDHVISWNLAAALVSAGRIEEYRAHCHQFLEWSANTQEFSVADVAAKASLLLPVEGTDFDRACRLADFAASATEPTWLVPWMQHVKVLAEYRRRRFDSAIDWAEQVLSSADATTACKASTLCIQACCYAHLQRMELARKAVTQADQIKLQSHDKTRHDFYAVWRDWVTVELLHREAEKLIERQSGATQSQPSAEKKLRNEDQSPNNSNPKSVPLPKSEP